ncbi:UDP-N-acetylmuramate--L-alanine ligase [uncultured Clostridium sp.]|nr:UDP-N-acetylmuramate--L-alanine ligase [uncultured Clostridium sp.]
MQPSIIDFSGKRVHMIGIGGSSMSGLATILQNNNFIVTGSDMSASLACEKLTRQGITVFIGHKAEQVDGADLVVYTAAIARDNPEYLRAQELDLPMMDRATLLGQIMDRYSRSIGVAGTHGKTTTTAMLATVLELAGADPTIHIGGELELIGGSVKSGKGDIFVTEACEYVKSFLTLHPTCAIVTNIEADHLDFFKDIEDIYSAFYAYTQLLPPDGLLIGCGDEERVVRLMAQAKRKAISYGFGRHNDYYATDIEFDDMGCAGFSIIHEDRSLGRVQLQVPGRHNVLDALAAFVAALQHGITVEAALSGLQAFAGANRRFQTIGTPCGVEVVQDYAHHPTEIRMLLETAARRKHNRLIAVFQPHTFTRTAALFNEFLTAFDQADEVIVTDIYAAREQNTIGITAQALCDALAQKGVNCRYIGPFAQIVSDIQGRWQPGDLVLVIGAGTVERVARMLCGKA